MKKLLLGLLIMAAISCEKEKDDLSYDFENVSINADVPLQKIQMFDDEKGYVFRQFVNNWPDHLTQGGSFLDPSAIKLDGSSATINHWELIDSVPDNNSLFMTQNGGSSWEPITIPMSGFLDASFANSQVGFVLAHNGVYKTVNSGETWDKVFSNKIIWDNNEFIGVFNRIVAIRENEFFLYSNHFFSRLTLMKVNLNTNENAILSSAEVNYPISNTILQEIIFYENELIILTTNFIYKSNDNGVNWVSIENDLFLSDIEIINSTTWIGTNGSNLQISTDSGNSWNFLSTVADNYGHRFVTLIDENTLFTHDYQNIRRTIDKGQTFTKMSIPEGLIYNILATKTGTIFAVGANGLILRHKHR